jgi:quercetin dioxygenase-like cupin family protein
MKLLLLAWMVSANIVALENDYVLVTRDGAPCASSSTPGCADRVIVALGDVELRAGASHRTMARGDIAVFGPGESYEPPIGGPFFEVAIKPDHPPVQAPPQIIPPEKNVLRYDGKDFFVFEERLDPGDTRARHSHSQRVVMQLNRTQLQQWLEDGREILVETVPDRATFNPPVIHTVKNIGDLPLRGIVIEFKPQPAPR